jgi:hypothetical protein
MNRSKLQSFGLFTGQIGYAMREYQDYGYWPRTSARVTSASFTFSRLFPV